jgi:hypothetical protein
LIVQELRRRHPELLQGFLKGWQAELECERFTQLLSLFDSEGHYRPVAKAGWRDPVRLRERGR